MIVSSNQFVLSSSPIALLRDFFPSLPSFPYLTSKGCLYSWSCGSSSLHSILDPLTMSSKHTKGVPTPHVREYLKTSAAQELPKKFPPIQVLEICKTGQSRDAENPCNFSSKSHRQSWVDSVSWRMFKGKIEKVFQPAWSYLMRKTWWAFLILETRDVLKANATTTSRCLCATVFCACRKTCRTRAIQDHLSDHACQSMC